MLCSKGNKDCKTCTKEKNDKWQEWLKSGDTPKHNPWLGYNERLRDSISWTELIGLLIFYGTLTLIWGWLGFVVAYIISYLTVLSGGLQIGYSNSEPKILQRECSLHKDCKFTRIIIY